MIKTGHNPDNKLTLRFRRHAGQECLEAGIMKRVLSDNKLMEMPCILLIRTDGAGALEESEALKLARFIFEDFLSISNSGE